MLVYINANGTIENVVPEKIYQGSNNATNIQIVAPMHSGTQADIVCTLPNGSSVDRVVLGSGETFDGDLNVWTFNIPYTLTEFAGTVSFSVGFYDATGTLLLTGQSTFVVSKTDFIDLPETPTEDVYSQILSNISNLSNRVESGLESLNDTKQDKVEETLWVEDKAVLTAILDNKNTNDLQSADIEKAQENISSNTQAIEDLKNSITTGVTIVGEMTGNTLPTEVELGVFVLDVMGRMVESGDVVKFVLTSETESSLVYTYSYSKNGWTSGLSTAVDLATNKIHGLIEGTFGVGSDNKILIDIVGGHIVAIYYKKEDGTTVDITSDLDLINTNIADIISGKQVVGKSTSAINDKNGNQIDTTYLTATDGATKDFVKEYAVAKVYNGLLYISQDGLVQDVPQEDIQFELTTNSIGEHEFANVDGSLGSEFTLSSNNGYTSNIYISASRTGEYEVKVRPYAVVDGVVKSLNVELSGDITLYEDSITRIGFNGNFVDLGVEELDFANADKIGLEISISTYESEETNFVLYSGETYTSTFQFTVQSETTRIAGMKDVEVKESDWVEVDGVYQAEIPYEVHLTTNTKNIIVYAKTTSTAGYETINVNYIVDNSGKVTLYSATAMDMIVYICGGISQVTLAEGVEVLNNLGYDIESAISQSAVTLKFDEISNYIGDVATDVLNQGLEISGFDKRITANENEIGNITSSIDSIDEDLEDINTSLDTKATKTYVDERIASIVGSAPETLNVLEELAQALGNDPNFATTTANQIGALQTQIDTKADSGTTNTALATLQTNVTALDRYATSTTKGMVRIEEYTNDDGEYVVNIITKD